MTESPTGGRAMHAIVLAAMLSAILAGCGSQPSDSPAPAQSSNVGAAKPPVLTAEGLRSEPTADTATSDQVASDPFGSEDGQLDDTTQSEPLAGETSTEDATADDQTAEAAIPNPDTLYHSWPQPDLVLFLSGQQHGYIEPCGCTGLENQKGGLARRHTLAQQLAERGWPLLALDVGNQVRRSGRQAEIKFQMTVDGFKTIGYDAVTFGTDDLKLSSGELAATTAAMDDQVTPFLSANAAIFDPEFTPTHKIIERGGQKVGITGVLGDTWVAEIKSDDIVRKSAQEALQEVLPKLKEANCDLHVLLAHATVEESRELAREFPEFQIVVTAGGDGDPAFQPERVGETLLVRVGVKGMHVGLIGVYADGEPRFRYQRLPLSAVFEDSKPMLALLSSYQQILEQQGLEGLGVRPLPHPTGRQFVGSQACADCHVDEYEIWEASPHAHATESLVHPPNDRSEIYRHFDPECLSCHVTGWNPQRFYPYQSGYLGLEASPLMHGSGCENCHGPGSQHVAAENGDVDATEEQLAEFRKAMWLSLESAEQHCMQCHDLDNSPKFHEEGAFDRFWDQIKH